MAATYEVFNDNKFRVGVSTGGRDKQHFVIEPELPEEMEEKDILYLHRRSVLFSHNILRVEDPELRKKMRLPELDDSYTDEKITDIFKLADKKFKEALQKVDADHVRLKIIEKAKDMNLNQSKIKIFKEVFNVDLMQSIEVKTDSSDE